MFKILLITAGILTAGISFSASLFAQDVDSVEIIDIVTVNDVKQLMADTFENVEDYIADIDWINGSAAYRGTIYYKKANKVLVEFEEPEDQIISTDGVFLYIYIPYLKVVVQQSLGVDTESTLLTSTSETGLTKLFDEYSFTFYGSSSLQPFAVSMNNDRIKVFSERIPFKNVSFQ